MSSTEDRSETAAGESLPRDLRLPVSLVVAHPGHELLAYGWLTRIRPLMFVVTDGSGRDADPRIDASARLLTGGLGRRASVFGRWTDRELYEALAEGRFDPFLALRDELVETWFAENIRTVICDAYERTILMHDLVQIVASAAVAAAERRGAEIGLLELPIYLGRHDVRPGNPRPAAAYTASDEVLRHKITAARNYASEVVRQEVEAFLGARGAEDFRVETLVHSIPRTPSDLELEPQPEWEKHGERLVREGLYDCVIRLREHVVPLARALEVPSRGAPGPR